MKNEEAIKVLKWALNRLDGHQYIVDGYGHVDPSAKVNAFSMAINALEKQIPKMVVRYHDDNACGMTWFKCPKCGCDFDQTEYECEVSYCSCGQAVDWLGVE